MAKEDLIESAGVLCSRSADVTEAMVTTFVATLLLYRSSYFSYSTTKLYTYT